MCSILHVSLRMQIVSLLARHRSSSSTTRSVQQPKSERPTFTQTAFVNVEGWIYCKGLWSSADDEHSWWKLSLLVSTGIAFWHNSLLTSLVIWTKTGYKQTFMISFHCILLCCLCISSQSFRPSYIFTGNLIIYWEKARVENIFKPVF